MPIPAVNQIVGSKGQFLGTPPTTADQQNATAVSEFNARFYQLGIRGYLFHYGISNTALVAANAIATGVTATAQPVLGLYNPLNSGVVLVPVKISLVLSTVANTAVAPGGFMQLTATNQTVTTGTTGYNTYSFAQNSTGKA